MPIDEWTGDCSERVYPHGQAIAELRNLFGRKGHIAIDAEGRKCFLVPPNEQLSDAVQEGTLVGGHLLETMAGEMISKRLNINPPQKLCKHKLDPQITKGEETFTHTLSLPGPPKVQVAVYDGNPGHMVPLEEGPPPQIPGKYDEFVENNGDVGNPNRTDCVPCSLLYLLREQEGLSVLPKDATTETINESMAAELRHPDSQTARLTADPDELLRVTKGRDCYGMGVSHIFNTLAN